MEVKEAMQKRRSVRKFTDECVCDEDVELMLHAAMSAPSACNKKPWDFYVVTDSYLLNEFCSITRYSGIKAKLAIIVCGNLSRALSLQLAPFWVQDCSAATENILLQATELGLGAVWCGIHPQKRAEEKLGALLGLSDKQVPLNIIYIGHPAETPEPRDQYDEKRVHYLK